MATCFSIPTWKVPWTEESGRLQSMGSQRVGHDWAIEHSYFCSGELEIIRLVLWTWKNWKLYWATCRKNFRGEKEVKGVTDRTRTPIGRQWEADRTEQDPSCPWVFQSPATICYWQNLPQLAKGKYGLQSPSCSFRNLDIEGGLEVEKQ